jgi:hypothetical protein
MKASVVRDYVSSEGEITSFSFSEGHAELAPAIDTVSLNSKPGQKIPFASASRSLRRNGGR